MKYAHLQLALFILLPMILVPCGCENNQTLKDTTSTHQNLHKTGMLAGAIDKETVAYWKFDDSSSPGRDSSGHQNELTLNGSPVVKDGCVYLKGGSIYDPKDKQDYLYSNSPVFNFSNTSFSVECWVKTRDIAHLELVGTRSTVRPEYNNQPGWALGLTQSKGAIIFILNDHSNKLSYALKNITRSTWDNDEWNYLVGIRDREEKILKLYLNGELVGSAHDECQDITNNRRLIIGYDAYAGCLTKGFLKNIKITKRVLSDKEIAEKYKMASQPKSHLKQITLKDEAYTPKNLQIDLTDGQKGSLNLQPQPVKMSYSREYIALQTPVYIQMPENPTQQELIAEKILQKEFKSRLGIKILTGSASPKGTIIKFGKLIKKVHSESYVLRINKSVITLNSNDNGIIYGALTLIQVLEQASLIKDATISLPEKMSIYDYPTIPNRIQVAGSYASMCKWNNHKIAEFMESVARTRLNTIALRISASDKLDGIKRIIDIADKYGVKVFVKVGYNYESRRYKRAVKIDDIPQIMKKFAEAAEAGAKGYIMLFDDISPCRKEMVNFNGTVGQFQRKFLVALQDTAKKNNINEVIVCPTMYFRGWQKSAKIWFKNESKFAHYFKDITQLPGGDMEMFYTDIASSEMDKVREAGVTKMAYYLNGAWDSELWFTFFTGPSRLSWSWYGFYIDPLKGPVPYPNIMQDWKNISKNGIRSVWVGNGSFEGSLLAGIWLWAPSEFDENMAIKEINRTIMFGPGTFHELMVYEKNMLPFVALFDTYINRWTAEWHIKVIKRKTPLTQNDLIEYWNKYKAARNAFENIKFIRAQNKSRVTRIHHLPNLDNYTRHVENALGLIRRKLISKCKRKNIVIQDRAANSHL